MPGECIPWSGVSCGGGVAALAKSLLVLLLGLSGLAAVAQPDGESGEPTPEEIDAAFTAEDAARVAAGFSGETAGGAYSNPLESMADSSDLVFRGTVVTQTYEYDAAGIPHTRTTFSITESLKGEHSSSQFVLVQPGGPDREDSDRVMMVSDAHYFNVGEEELLFVNLDPQNPHATLRATVNNRFRILRDKVYNEDGYGVAVEPLLGGAYRLSLGNRHGAEQRFSRINIGSHRLDKRFAGEDGQTPDRGGAGRLMGDADPHQVEATGAVDIEIVSELIRR